MNPNRSKSMTIAFRCPNDLALALEAKAMKIGITKTALIVGLLVESLEVPQNPIETKVLYLENQIDMILKILTDRDLI